jgi:hypothetical protein
LAPQEGKLSVQVQKRRGGDVAKPILIDVDAITTATLPDWRTSAGYGNAERASSLRSIRSAH